MKKIKLNDYGSLTLDEFMKLKLIIGYRKNGKLAFELENFGRVWFLSNYDLKDYKNCEFTLDEVIEFLKDMNRRGISYEIYDYAFFESIKKCNASYHHWN
jgi:hypothetical protein